MTQKKTAPKKADEVLVVDQDQQTTPAQIISQAIAGGANLEQIEKLMILQQKWEENEAKKAYHVAMAAFKANPPKIEKTKQVDYETSKGRTKYKHALLADAAEKINRGLSEHGLSAGWGMSQDDKGNITVTCKITHKLGHSESTSLTAAPDTSGGKNAIQAVGSTVSYLERYTLLSLTGLASHDMDDDGKGAGPEIKNITEVQVNELHALITDNSLDKKDPKYMTKFLQYMKAESLDDILAKDFTKAKNAVMAAVKRIKSDK
jgi:hypothetical protein